MFREFKVHLSEIKTIKAYRVLLFLLMNLGGEVYKLELTNISVYSMKDLNSTFKKADSISETTEPKHDQPRSQRMAGLWNITRKHLPDYINVCLQITLSFNYSTLSYKANGNRRFSTIFKTFYRSSQSFPNFWIMFRKLVMIAEGSELGLGRWFDVCRNVSDNFFVGKDVCRFPRKSKGDRGSSN